ncbi:hypothetical protein PM082_024000 [Marasmius tenuissimus]|nr:hypothetical protein PM082_024000 [Marasmius tenuissimus]
MHLQDHLLLTDCWASPFVPVSVFRQEIKVTEQWLSQPTTAPPSPVSPTALSPPSPPPPYSSPPPSVLPSSSPAQPSWLPTTPLPQPPTSTPQMQILEASQPLAPTSANIRNDAQSEDDNDEEEEEIEITGERFALHDVMDDYESDDGEEPIILQWEPPESLLVDATLWSGIKNHRFPKFDSRLYAPHPILQYIFEAPQYERLDSAT